MKSMKPSRKQRRKIRYHAAQIKYLLFLGFLLLFGFIGILWFARPDTSTIEKRTLTKFPSLSISGIWDGSFFSGVDTWYADTYPLREGLIGADQKFESLYGIRGQQLVSDGETADEIPDEGADLEELAKKDESEEEYDGTGANDVETPAEKTGTIYITQNCGYGVYFFSESGSAKYCLLVNQLAKALQGKAQVYTLIAPISEGIMLSDNARKSTGGSDENEAIKWMYGKIDNSVKKVWTFNALKAHNNEYIYFHTDHHWTALGAYYAYCEYCKEKGVTPHELTDFETYTFKNFLGTFYASSNQSPALAANPDTVTAYIPNGTNTVTTYFPNGKEKFKEIKWPIVNDVSDYAKSELYATFSAGDQPYNYAHNEKITDGSSVLVVKDSFGNAFIPFMVDHYEHIYWIDYRSYKRWCKWAEIDDCSISDLVERQNIQDVILCNNINTTGSKKLLGKMKDVFK